jgi:hypothetical protein
MPFPDLQMHGLSESPESGLGQAPLPVYLEFSNLLAFLSMDVIPTPRRIISAGRGLVSISGWQTMP